MSDKATLQSPFAPDEIRIVAWEPIGKNLCRVATESRQYGQVTQTVLVLPDSMLERSGNESAEPGITSVSNEVLRHEKTESEKAEQGEAVSVGERPDGRLRRDDAGDAEFQV